MSEWISVDERLPEDDLYVLGFADEFGEFLGWRERGYWKQGHALADGEYIALVTHWMPIPELPDAG